MRILVLDNYDSFVYNLVYMLRALGDHDVTVKRNDKIAIGDVEQYDKILLSPGPGIPDEAGLMKEIIEAFGAHKSILGVCLGHQAIAEVYGASLFNLRDVLHGIEGEVTNYDDSLFQELSDNFKVGHYHSWAVKEESVKTPLKITAKDANGLVMGISHEQYDVKGLQFHPESILTAGGLRIMKNWLKTDKELVSNKNADSHKN